MSNTHPCTGGRKRHAFPKKGPKVCIHCGYAPGNDGGSDQPSSLSTTPATPSIDDMLNGSTSFGTTPSVAEFETTPVQKALHAPPFGDAPTAPDVDTPTAVGVDASPESTGSGPVTALNGTAEHSPLGASSASRWMACPGSANLVNALKLNYGDRDDGDPEWTRQGQQAHALAAECLETESEAWMLVDPAKHPDVNAKTLSGVQVYLDYVNSIPGRKRYEVRYHLPELHPQMYGTIDTEAYSPSQVEPVRLEIVDFKNGAGVYVTVEHNVQLMYYAALVVYSDPGAFIGSDTVKLTIVQPNAPGTPVRSWLLTVQELRDWVNRDLLPAMSLASVGGYLELGKHCQFCPAKLACPAMRQLLLKSYKMAPHGGQEMDWQGINNDELGQMFTELRPLAFYRKAIEAEVYRRLMDRQPVFNAKLIEGRVNRVWKEDFEPALRELFGADGYTKPEPLSVAQVENLPGGKAFVAEYGYKPAAGLNVAYADDSKPAVVPKLASEMHVSELDKLV